MIQANVRDFHAWPYLGVDLVAGGVPCPPFSIAGKQLGKKDERDLFPEALRIVEEAQPRAVMLENVQGFASAKFDGYRKKLVASLKRLGYIADWRILNASDYGVPQLRPRFVLVALRPEYVPFFRWPDAHSAQVTVGEALGDLMAAGGWRGAKKWARMSANGIAPTLVGGSKKHGGPDLGPTRARKEWAKLGVDGRGVYDAPPDKKFPVDGMPRLTVQMAARIQGFPDDWVFAGRKTAAYRQIGNAFPPPVATAVARSIISALEQRPKKLLSIETMEVESPLAIAA